MALCPGLGLLSGHVTARYFSFHQQGAVTRASSSLGENAFACCQKWNNLSPQKAYPSYVDILAKVTLSKSGQIYYLEGLEDLVKADPSYVDILAKVTLSKSGQIYYLEGLEDLVKAYILHVDILAKVTLSISPSLGRSTTWRGWRTW